MATATERELMTQNYLAEIKSKVGICPMLEESGQKMLHINAPVGGWREWMILTYDQNVLADWLVRENEELRKVKEDLEMKIKALSNP